MLRSKISANCLPTPYTRDPQAPLMGAHLPSPSVTQPSLSAAVTNLQRGRYMSVWRNSPRSWRDWWREAGTGEGLSSGTQDHPDLFGCPPRDSPPCFLIESLPVHFLKSGRDNSMQSDSPPGRMPFTLYTSMSSTSVTFCPWLVWMSVIN